MYIVYLKTMLTCMSIHMANVYLFIFMLLHNAFEFTQYLDYFKRISYNEAADDL